ncbi:MAG: hypothetical protein Q7R52_01285 [archaeon]|nr:hypothetical protein [archaeon]
MTQLEKIKLALESNPDIYFHVNIIDNMKNGSREAYSAQVYDFQIAPKKRIALDTLIAERMNKFMRNFVIDIVPDEIIDFREEEGFLVPGRLSFEELIAEERISTTRSLVVYGGLGLSRAFGNMPLVAVKSYKRRIYVSPFPSRKIAKRYLYTNYIGCINLEEFRKK